jgi:hypothetical protein
VTPPPPPLEWHPAYRDRPWLIEWLNDPTETEINLAAARRPRFEKYDPDEPVPDSAPSFPILRLTKSRARGSAPYVGRPFVYEWFVAHDEHGRFIASEAVPRYLDNLTTKEGE